ncbi:hypothetical protein MTR67_053712 [Solanum verrucosum]|uniref:Uncharacterized protein n=1 Tax=Solanum verrucosum TaxID=315347 RepID=A0AAF0V998_SOLVR|nr:hypothetical protein MTR67_053712 [Solanum verrucosum]
MIAVVLNFIEQQLLDDLEVELRKREESITSEELKLEMEKEEMIKEREAIIRTTNEDVGMLELVEDQRKENELLRKKIVELEAKKTALDKSVI